jgi:hypothetical protein
LVKGRTFKEKKETIETQVNEVSGNISEKRISTDVFVIFSFNCQRRYINPQRGKDISPLG